MTHATEGIDAMRGAMAEATGTDAADWYPVLKARYGMAEACTAIAARGSRQSGGDRPTVLTQLLTCATAVDPLLVAGLRPLYGDIDAATYSLSPRALDAQPEAAAVMIQHTFGVVSEPEARALAAAARGRGAVVLEDSAHCAGRMARGTDGMPLADVSFHSFGVEKMLATKFGGAVWVNPAMADAPLRRDMTARLSALPAPGARLRFALRTYRLQRAVLNRLPGALARSIEAALTRVGLFEPAVARAETEGRLARAALAPSADVAADVVSALRDLPEVQRRRAAAVDAYLEALGDAVAAPERLAGQPLVRMPLLVPHGVDPEAVMARLRAQGVYAGRWYRPVLFPGTASPEAYAYDPSDRSVPVTDDVVARLVNLPTLVDPERAREIAGLALAAIDSCRDARA